MRRLTLITLIGLVTASGPFGAAVGGNALFPSAPLPSAPLPSAPLPSAHQQPLFDKPPPPSRPAPRQAVVEKRPVRRARLPVARNQAAKKISNHPNPNTPPPPNNTDFPVEANTVEANATEANATEHELQLTAPANKTQAEGSGIESPHFPPAPERLERAPPVLERAPPVLERAPPVLERAPRVENHKQLPQPKLETIGSGAVSGEFPALPPDPYAAQEQPLPPLAEELWLHGGSQLYQAEGDRLNWPSHEEAHYDLLRLPEDWRKPRPLEAFTSFLGPGPIADSRFHWPGASGYAWEPRFVGYGSYELFGFALEENGARQDIVGQQLLVDLDLRLTGTERFHMQFRPLGKNGSGGSYQQLNNPQGYVDNSTASPDRFWFEAELHSLLGAFLDPSAVRDYHVVLGQFPFALHNSLLINDDILGFVINKNTLYYDLWSNINVQVFGAYDDVDAFPNAQAQLYGGHVSADRNRVFYEATYAYVRHAFDAARNSHYAAVSRTELLGPLTLAGRALFKYGDQGGSGRGQLFVLESNRTRVYEHGFLGIEKGAYYGNLFLANGGWTPISGANFNRLRTSFASNPLVRISAGAPPSDTWGAAFGVQLFRHHEDESWIPEIAYEERAGQPVAGASLRYLRKTGARTFLEAVGAAAISDDPRFQREGVSLSHTVVF